MADLTAVKRGAQLVGKGATGPFRGDMTGSLVVNDAHGRYAEAVRGGGVYFAQGASLTPGTALSTTAAMTLFNPYGSTVNLELLFVGIGYRTGTLGAGYYQLCPTAVIGEAIPTGTAIISYNCMVGGAKGQGTALKTATLANAPVSGIPIAMSGAFLATTAIQLHQVLVDVSGLVILPPGTSVSLEGIATGGTSPLIDCTLVWEEVVIS
jgi:hypothetical protein